MEEMNAPARALLAVEGTEPRHFTDFVVPGGLDDAIALFDIVRTTGLLEATVLLQPTTGDAMAVDARVTALDGGNGVVGVFRLASDIDAAPLAMNWPRLPPPERVDYLPPTDVAFRTYADRALARMPEPTIDGFTLRLRRLYPHAHVEAERTSWVAHRDRRESEAGGGEPWWRGENLPRVQYDALALILAANDQATAFFGQPLVGRHWQELVTAGSTEEVAAMLEILAEVGAAESRFRMPRGDGSLVEFDSYTEAQAGEFSTVFRPIPDPG
jgi:hypothetical protein